MQEINQTFNEIFSSSYDKPFNLEALAPWSKDIATELAAKEGIKLTPAHDVTATAANVHRRVDAYVPGKFAAPPRKTRELKILRWR